MSPPQSPSRARWYAGVALLSVLAASGCAARKADVNGCVRYRNQPVTNGSVSFYCENGEIRSSLISADGTYHLTQMAPGPVRVAVVSHPRVPQGLHVNRAPASLAPRPREKAVPDKPMPRVPPRYYRPESSGLNFVVDAGAQTIDIDLAP